MLDNSLPKKQIGTLEQKIQHKIFQAKKDSETLITEAKQKAFQILDAPKKRKISGEASY